MDNYHVEGYKVRFKHYRHDQGFDNVVTSVKRGEMSARVVNAIVGIMNMNDVLGIEWRLYERPSLHGGKTECYIVDPTTNTVVADGVALCSWKDCFSRKVGRDISFGRAVKRLQEMQNMEVDCAETRTTA